MRRRQFLKWLGIAPVAAMVAPTAVAGLLPTPKLPVEPVHAALEPDLEEYMREAFARALAKAEDEIMVNGGRQLTGQERLSQDVHFLNGRAEQRRKVAEAFHVPSVYLKASSPMSYKTAMRLT